MGLKRHHGEFFVESVFGAQLSLWEVYVFIRCKPRQLLFPVCSAVTLCRKCQGLASFPQPSLSALLFFSSVSPLRPTPLYLFEKRKTLSQRSRPWCSLHIFQQQSLHLVWELLWNQQTPTRVHACTGPTFALEQLNRRSNCGAVHHPAYIFGGGEKAGLLQRWYLGFLFLDSSRPSTTTAVSFLLLLWQSNVRNSLSLCTSQN